MAQITFISVGTLKESYLKEGVSEYAKRLSQYAKVQEVVLAEEVIRNEDDKSEIARALNREAEKISAAIPKDSYKIALCVEGRELDSPALAEAVKKALDSKGKIAFIIGSSHGLADSIKGAADFKLSFSRLTFPHQLMKLVLFEAVYRSFTIIAGKKYHK